MPREEALTDAPLQPGHPGHTQCLQQPHQKCPILRLQELREPLLQLQPQGCAARPWCWTPAPRGLKGLQQPLQPLDGDILESHEVDDGTLALLSSCSGWGGSSPLISPTDTGGGLPSTLFSGPHPGGLQERNPCTVSRAGVSTARVGTGEGAGAFSQHSGQRRGGRSGHSEFGWERQRGPGRILGLLGHWKGLVGICRWTEPDFVLTTVAS